MSRHAPRASRTGARRCWRRSWTPSWSSSAAPTAAERGAGRARADLEKVAVGVAQDGRRQAELAQAGFDRGAIADDDDAGGVGIDVALAERAQVIGGRAPEGGDETHRLVERQAVKAQLAEGGRH